MHLQKPILGTELDFENPLNKGLMMHLGMLEGHGDRVYDLSKYGNHGVLHNFAYPPTAASGWNPGRDGVAPNLDGVDDYIDCGSNIGKPVHWTAEVWGVPEDNGCLACNRLGDFTEWGPQFNGDVLATYVTHQTTAQAQFASSTINLVDVPANKSSHFVITVDGSNIKFFLDGRLHDIVAQTIQMEGTSARMSIGRNGNFGGDYFDGLCSLVRTLNRAYTPAEVLEQYMNPNGVYLQ